MIWGAVVRDWRDVLVADAELIAALGGAPRIYRSSSSLPVTIPSVQYFAFDDREDENFNMWTMQVDFWSRNADDAEVIETRLRTLTDRDVSYELGGRSVWTHYDDARDIDYPKEPGVIHRSLDFLFKTLRARRTLTYSS